MKWIRPKIIKSILSFKLEKILIIYLSSLLVCTLFATYKYLKLYSYDSIKPKEFYIHLIIILTVWIICSIICIKLKVVRSVKRKKIIKNWELVQKYEKDKKKKINNILQQIFYIK